jgi:uncharacterized protein
MLMEFEPPIWLPEGHSQTIWSSKVAVSHTQDITWRRRTWTTPDNDTIQVDSHNDTATGPVLVLFHGLEGGSESHYSKAFAQACTEQGWSTVIPHFRGCGGPINTAPRAYHSGDAPEIDWMLAQVQREYRHRPMVAVGVSLGGNALMRWVGELGDAAGQRVGAAVAISSPLDLVAAGRAIDQGVNRWLYARMFLSTMRKKAQQKWNQYPGLFDLEQALRAHTLEAFDDAFTAPLHGYDGVMDYWARASAKPVLGDIKIPALLLNACNDPFVPAWSLPQAIDVANSVDIQQPKNGGHVGFCQNNAQAGWRASVLEMPRAVCAWLAHNTSEMRHSTTSQQEVTNG